MSEFAGFVTLEDTVQIPVLTESTASVPTDADATPTYTIYHPSTGDELASGTVTNPGDVASVTGAYILSHAITSDAGFAAGKTYTVLVSYQISASQRRQWFTFTVS
jgi:hypothetical protein